MDLNSISSNLLLIGFALVSICCLYLLYSNFTKVREIEDLKRKVEDLKKIFFNTQQHNDETYARILSMMQNPTLMQGGEHPEMQIIPEHPPFLEAHTLTNDEINTIKHNNIDTEDKVINIDTSINDIQTTSIIINKEGSVSNNNNSQVKETTATHTTQNEIKEITLDLEELDELEPAEDNTDVLDTLDNLDDIENENLENLLNDEQNNIDNYTDDYANGDNCSNLDKHINPNIFEIDNIDDTISITTDPINEDLDAIIGTIDMDDINTETNTHLDDLIIENIDDNIKKVDITLDDMDLNDILNGNNTTLDSNVNNDAPQNTNTDVKNTLHNMSIKQLKDLAKTHKLKTTGTKNELITALSKVL